MEDESKQPISREDFYKAQKFQADKIRQIEADVALEKRLKEEREVSNNSYAPMIVKTIVFGFIGLICVAFIGYLTALVWHAPK